MQPEFLKQVVEALIIANDEPISAHQISALVEELTPAKVKKFVDKLNAEYEETKRAFFIAAVAGGYQFTTRKSLAPWIKKLYKGRIRTRLTQASLESLAIIVFRQPVSRVEIDAIRGVNSGGVVKNLLERNLITIKGRADGPGKPLLYGSTKELLQYLGVNELDELPKPKEIAEIMGKLDSEQGMSEDIMDALTASDDPAAEEAISENGEPATVASSDTGNETETMNAGGRDTGPATVEDALPSGPGNGETE